MSPARNKLQKARTHPPKGSSENDSPTRHHRTQSDAPQSPQSQENRWKRKSRDSRGRSNSVLTSTRTPLRELSPSERNGGSPSPERVHQPMPPLLRMEIERETQRLSLVERQDRGTPSATYSKSPFPSQASQILLPSPTTSSFILPPPEETRNGSWQTGELSAGISDAPEFFSGLVPEPLATDHKRKSTNSTIRSVTEDEDLFSLGKTRPSSDLYGSLNSRSSMMRSTIRSIQPSEEFPSAESARSSASSETFSTRCHEDRKSTGSNWTIHPPMSASTRPTSTNPRTPSPFGISTPRTPLFGPRSPGVSKEKRPVSTFGNPLSPFLEADDICRPSSASDAYSEKVSVFNSSDKLLDDFPSTSTSSAARKAYLATSNPAYDYLEARSASGMTSTTGEDSEPVPLCIPKRAARSNERGNSHPSTSAQPEPIQRLPTIPSGTHSGPLTESSNRNPANESLVSLPTMYLESRPVTQDRGEESSATAAARAGIPPIKNPWQSMDSSSFFNLMMGRDGDNVRASGNSSRPTTGASRSSNATVLYVARGLPAWARSFYSTGDTSVLGSSRPSTRSKPSSNSLRHEETQGSNSSGRRNDRYDSRTASSSHPTNTAPTDSPASSEFSIASIRRPRNRPHSTIYSENWSPSPNPAVHNDDGNDDDDDDDDDDDENYDNYSAGIEPHNPSTGHSNHPHHPQGGNRLSISQVPTTTDYSQYGSSEPRQQPHHHYHQGHHLRPFGTSDPDSNATPRLHRSQSSTFRCLRPSSWIVGGAGSAANPNRPAADRQMWLFCLGFVLPFAWMLAALLPVPARRDMPPSSYSRHSQEEEDEKKDGEATSHSGGGRNGGGGGGGGEGGVITETGSGGVVDVEAQMAEAQNMALAEKERIRAVWWRTLNRRMCVVGVAVIIVAVAVAVPLTVV